MKTFTHANTFTSWCKYFTWKGKWIQVLKKRKYIDCVLVTKERILYQKSSNQSWLYVHWKLYLSKVPSSNGKMQKLMTRRLWKIGYRWIRNGAVKHKKLKDYLWALNSTARRRLTSSWAAAGDRWLRHRKSKHIKKAREKALETGPDRPFER